MVQRVLFKAGRVSFLIIELKEFYLIYLFLILT